MRRRTAVEELKASIPDIDEGKTQNVCNSVIISPKKANS